jgi:hypothetical protein
MMASAAPVGRFSADCYEAQGELAVPRTYTSVDNPVLLEVAYNFKSKTRLHLTEHHNA